MLNFYSLITVYFEMTFCHNTQCHTYYSKLPLACSCPLFCFVICSTYNYITNLIMCCYYFCLIYSIILKTREAFLCLPKEVLFSAVSRAWRRQWHPTPVLLPRKFHGRRSLVGCSPCGCEESDMTERPHFHFSLSCIGEGNGNPLQCFCRENPRDGGAWWAAVYGVAQSRTRLKQLSHSRSSHSFGCIHIVICYHLPLA